MTSKKEIETVDPIIVSVIGNRFDAISKEIGQTMLRTSRSPIFSEARDFVTAIFDKDLRLIAQTAYIPVLMGALPYAMQNIFKAFEGDIHEGDVFILNDPYKGNNHPPDITVAKPVFWDGNIQFWSVSKGHHADVGGGGVAGYNPQALSIWDECLLIPPVRLYHKGQYNRDVWDLIKANVQLVSLVEGDLHCQVGACNIGERSLLKLIDKYGTDLLSSAIDRVFDASEMQMVSMLREIPNGEYSAERLIDHDGIDKHKQIKVAVKLVVSDKSITFDFSHSDKQVKGYVNSTLANTASSSFLALFLCIGGDTRLNEGALRTIEVVAPEGLVVNALAPAPVTGCTIAASQAIIEATWLALSQAIPDKVDAAWGRWCAPATMGINPRTGRHFADIHFMCKGGAGASKGIDGWDHLGTVCCAGGLQSPDPELHELVNPYTILNCEIWPDSAGPGQWRGGLGTLYRWRVDADNIQAANFGGGVSENTAPFGLMGGKAAPAHKLCIHRDGDVIPVDAESLYQLKKGDIFEIYESGGGGYGDPFKRDKNLVLQDVINGYVSCESAAEDYGVVIDQQTLSINQGATNERRGTI